MLGKLCRSENSGVAELKEDGQVSCDTAQNLRLLCSYITPHARAAARPHAGASTSLAFSSSFTVPYYLDLNVMALAETLKLRGLNREVGVPRPCFGAVAPKKKKLMVNQ